MQTIEVNGSEIQITQDKAIAVTKQVFDVFDIEARVNTVSTLFSIPSSIVNDVVIGHSLAFDNNNSFAYSNHAVSIFQDGVPIMQNGRLLVNGYNGDGLDCLAIDDNGDIYAALNAITWDDVVDYVAANIQSSLFDMGQTFGTDSMKVTWLASNALNDPSTDYMICPIAKPTTSRIPTGNTIWAYQFSIPHMFVTRLLEVILATIDTTYTFNGTPLDDWTDGVIPVNEMKITERAKDSFQGVAAFTSFNDVGSTPSVVSCRFTSWLTNANTISFSSEYTGGTVNFGIGTVWNSEATAIRAGDIESETALINVIVDIQGTIPVCDAFSIIRFDSGTSWTEVYYENLFGGGFTDFRIEAEVERGGAPDFQIAVLFWNGTAPGGLVSGEIRYELVVGDEVKGGMPFDLIGNLPFDTPSDAFRFIIAHYGLIPVYDKFSKNLTLNPQIEVINNITNAHDWSDKLDTFDVEEATYYLEGLGQSTRFSFANSDEQGGRGIITVQATNLPEVVDFFESDAERSREVVYANNLTVEYDVVEVVVDAATALGFDIERTGSMGVRIGKIATAAQAIKVWNGATAVSVPNLKIVVQGRLNDFQLMIDNYYQLIESAYSQPKILTANFTLSAAEVEAFDFTRPVYIEKFGRYFYVNSIDNFISGQPVSVTLIAI